MTDALKRLRNIRIKEAKKVKYFRMKKGNI